MKKNKTLFVILAHLAGWIIFLAIPFLFSPQPPPELRKEFGKLYLMQVFTNSLFLILLFYLNYFILIPRFFFANRYIIYTLVCIACIGIKFFSPLIFIPFLHEPPFYAVPPPRPAIPPDLHTRMMLPIVFNNSVLMYVVILLASLGLRLNNRWKLTEQKRLQSELSSLKSQINPHFLFNTLNSIYAETLGKADNASGMLLKLSSMMRYTITEAHHDKVPLQKEFDYITNYIELQKLRLASNAKLEYQVSGDAQALQIAPFLLIPFVENAFKYGVNSEQNSLIQIMLSISNNELHLMVFNKKVKTEKTIQETSGLGVKNTRQRLSLTYPEKHLLTINETNNSYTISLYITLA
ncbi:MAG: histidine kinase [Chitinophagaceae bacterium]|nr:histidine kinase [Chitinophagaceae bacterium]